MPLNDFLSLTDDSLRAKYEAKPVDKAAVRKPFVKALKTAIDQFNNGRTKAPNRMWTANGDTVKFTPKLRGEALAISNKTEHFIPAERFVEALTKLIANVEAGELDAALAAPVGEVGATKTRAASTGTRSAESNLKSTVSAMRRFEKSDAEITAALEEKGADAETIKALLAYKPVKKGK